MSLLAVPIEVTADFTSQAGQERQYSFRTSRYCLKSHRVQISCTHLFQEFQCSGDRLRHDTSARFPFILPRPC